MPLCHTRGVNRKFSFRWMLAAFVLIAGGMAISAFTLGILTLSDPRLGHAGFFLGACAGGYAVGRLSPGMTVFEPAAAGFLLTGLLFGFFGLSPGSSLIWSEGTGVEMLHRALTLGGSSVLGGLVGAVAGERASERRALESDGIMYTLWQMWIAVMAYAGCLLIGCIGFLILTQETGTTIDDIPGLFLLAFAGAAVASGAIAQALSHKQALGTSSSGPFLLYTALGVLVCIKTGQFVAVAIFMSIGGGFFSLLAMVGAAIAGKRGERQPKASAPPLATARVTNAPRDPSP